MTPATREETARVAAGLMREGARELAEVARWLDGAADAAASGELLQAVGMLGDFEQRLDMARRTALVARDLALNAARQP